MYRVVAWIWLVCVSTHGRPHGGRRAPVKRSDFTMYDNQFFSVGDTKLDNEVTDCGLIKHQYARGYIRLREYLERIRGCGTKGRRTNIAGIAASTKDASQFTSDGFRIPSPSVVAVAPYKPHTIGQVIDNTKAAQAYNSQGNTLYPQTPFQQQGLQRSQTSRIGFNNLGFTSQVSGALSYKTNMPYSYAAQLPVARKVISRTNFAVSQPQALKTLNSAKNREKGNLSPDPQRYYSEQTGAMAHAYNAPIAVGQPLLRANPLPLAFNQKTSASNVGGTVPQEDQPANPDLDIDKTNVKAAQEKLAEKAQTENRFTTIPSLLNHLVKPPVQDVAGHVKDDIEGQQDYSYGMRDEGTDSEIDSEESDPIPSQTSFTVNTKLDDEDKTPDVQQKFDSSKGKSSEGFSQIDVRPSEIVGKKTENNPSLSDVPLSVNNDEYANEPQNTNGAENDLANKETDNKKLNKLLKPAIDKQTNDAINEALSVTPTTPIPTARARQQYAPSVAAKKAVKSGSLDINLDVLKNKITSSKDVGFLRRMLTLIKKITQHKDFDKLAGIQKKAIIQAGTAVNNAVMTTPNAQRSFIQPRPPATKKNDYSAFGRPAYAINSYINSANRPPHWKPGDYTGYPNAQLHSAPQQKISKKFQIERNPYYPQEQARAAYTPPYFSLQRLNYGIYNGNVP